MLEGINCFYFALLGVGILYALVILITGGLHDFAGGVHLPADFGGHHIPALGDHGDTSVPSLSPITVASFVTAFGAFGIVATQGLSASGGMSILVAAVGGLIIAAIAHFAFGYFLIAPQGSSEVTMKDIVGATAEVTTPIPVGGLGEVTFVAQGARVSYPARSLDRIVLPRGTTVTIIEEVGSVVHVRARTSFK